MCDPRGLDGDVYTIAAVLLMYTFLHISTAPPSSSALFLFLVGVRQTTGARRVIQIGTSLRAKRCAKVQRQARHPRPVAVVVVDLHPQVVAPIGMGMPRVVVAVTPEAAATHRQQSR